MIWKDVSVSKSDELEALVFQLNQKRPFHPNLVNLLMQRGIKDLDASKDWLKPDRSQLHSPWLFKDMEKAVQRILHAVESGEKIMLFGDYDVDGTSSVALMRLFFKDWGLDIPYYIPDRFSEGYGLSIEGIDFGHGRGVTLLITLDCGAKAVDKIRYAKAQGMDVIVVDHHTVAEEESPFHAMVNPRQNGCTYPYPELPACGLALKLAMALHEKFLASTFLPYRPDYEDVFDRYCDLVSLAIASDIVQLTGENRVIAAYGLRKLNTNPLPGIQALMALSETPRTWTIEDLVFFIGPRINSAGRLYKAQASVDLLSGNGIEIRQFASDLNEYNKERKDLDVLIFAEALAQLENEPRHSASTVLWDSNWNKGVIGIVASKLIERHYRPTILLAESNGKFVGSARSVEDFDLYAALEACNEHLLQFGGHKYAAGMTIEPSRLDAFKEAFEKHVASLITEDQKQPKLLVSGELDFSEINEYLLNDIRLFGPFGPGNMEPVWVARNVQVVGLNVLKREHLRLDFEQNKVKFEGIGFGLAGQWKDEKGIWVDIAFQPDVKRWRDRSYIQLKVKDFRQKLSPTLV